MKHDFSYVKMPLSQKSVQFIPLFHLFPLDLLATEKIFGKKTQETAKTSLEKQNKASKDLHLFNKTFHTQKCKAPALLLMMVSA